MRASIGAATTYQFPEIPILVSSNALFLFVLSFSVFFLLTMEGVMGDWE